VAVLPPPNSLLDIYRGFSAGSPYPPSSATPAASGLGGYLRPHVRNGRFGSAAGLHWTHLLLLPDGVDIRSAYNSELNMIVPANADTVLVPDYPLPGWCTAFYVVLVQRIRGEQNFLRVCLDRLQPRQGGCTTSGIVLPCCPVPLPATVHATIPAGSGCPCMDGTVVTLTYNALSQSWSGSTSVCFGDTLTIVFKCGSTSCADATVTATSVFSGSSGPVRTTGCSCNPLNMVFSGATFPNPGSECFGPITIVVTA
jgi:hypothetical protein